MAEPESSYNGTLWAVRGPRQITCFRVRVDAGGRVTTTAVGDFNQFGEKGKFDEALRAKLHERYGEQTKITIVIDGGAGFEYFRRELAAGRYPVPPAPVETPPKDKQGKQMDLWDEQKR